MNESAACQALLSRAYESAAPSAVWGEADRAWADRTAAARVGEHAAPHTLIAQRSALVADRLVERDPTIGSLRRALAWRPWFGQLAVGLAFVAGLATDALSAGTRVNVLAAPLLGVLCWNLAVYAMLAARGLGATLGRRPGRASALVRGVARLARASSRAALAGATPSARFARDWLQAGAALSATRAAQVLHAAAAALAAGLLTGLYLRGLAFEYLAGWESTFLDASAVRRLLGVVLAPASALTGIALPDEARLAAIRVGAGPGENAAPWIHLYAATTALFVLLPRAMLAAVARRQARRLAADFPLSLDDGYFEAIVRRVRGDPARVHVIPYSFHLQPASVEALQALLAEAFGPRARVELAPSVTPQQADEMPSAPPPGSPNLVVALFNLSATPEAQTHGAFVGALRERLPAGVPLLAMVDEAAFGARFRGQAQRLEERRSAWRSTLGEAGVQPVFVELDARAAAQSSTALRNALEHAR
jgi:hypothetical protein